MTEDQKKQPEYQEKQVVPGLIYYLVLAKWGYGTDRRAKEQLIGWG